MAVALPFFYAPIAVTATETLVDVIDNQAKSNQTAAATQQNIDALIEQSRRLLDEYRDVLRRAETLNAYNAHLRQLVNSQEAEKQSLEKQQTEIESTRREIVPLMIRMLDALERFVQLDRPFLAEERNRRVTELKTMMTQPDVSDAEKFRRLLDAYKFESDYGNTLESYRGDLAEGGKSRTVDFLRIGRVALLYRSLDGRETGVWNSKTRRWQSLPNDYIEAVSKGLDVARKEMPAELFPIAVEPPEVLQ